MDVKRDPKIEAIGQLLRRRFGQPESVLVAGCGDGVEAARLARQLDTRVVGIDMVDSFDPDAAERVELRVADVLALPFPDETFDLVFSFHMLEHVADPPLALEELRRVLRPRGGFWIGTPSSSRLVGYLGSRDASLQEKLAWNLLDWRARLRGRFRNELGAHAGFTGRELRALLESVFAVVDDETAAYYALLYPRYRPLLALAERSGLARFLFPSIYFAGFSQEPVYSRSSSARS